MLVATDLYLVQSDRNSPPVGLLTLAGLSHPGAEVAVSADSGGGL